jgi:hypothetical protein
MLPSVEPYGLNGLSVAQKGVKGLEMRTELDASPEREGVEAYAGKEHASGPETLTAAKVETALIAAGAKL